MELYDLFLKNTGGSIHKNLHYFAIYEKHFRPFVNKPITFLEIGAGGGGSSQMWKSYFGPFAKIVAIDIRPECAAFEDFQVKIRIGDQSDPAFLASIVNEFGPPDIVLDDGSHVMDHIHESFKFLYQHVTKGGVYMIEDLHTAYWPEFGGGLRAPSSFIEYSKDLIDEMNAEYTRGALPANAFSQSTVGIHFYDSIIVFDKGSFASKQSVIIGDQSLYR